MRRFTLALLAAAGFAFAQPLPAFAKDVAVKSNSGVDARKLAGAVEWLKTDVERARIPGAVILVARDGKILLHEAVGWADKDKKIPMARNSVHPIASST